MRDIVHQDDFSNARARASRQNATRAFDALDIAVRVVVERGAGTRLSGAAPFPFLSVVIPTRDRGASAVKAIESVLANRYPEFEIIVVDQSADALTEKAVEPYLGGPVRYVRSASTGVASARNEGVQNARGEYIAFVDDDCEVARDWLQQLEVALSRDNRIGVLFGNVAAAPHDSALGVVPAYEREAEYTACSIEDKNRVEGISACMATTQTAWLEIGGFDVMLGAGSPLLSGAEVDYAIRLLLAGYHVCETPRFQVLHHGYRDWEQAEQLVYRYWFGTGALFAKHMKNRQWKVVKIFLELGARWIGGGRSRVSRSFGARAFRWRQLTGFAKGFLAGAFTPADKSTNLFR